MDSRAETMAAVAAVVGAAANDSVDDERSQWSSADAIYRVQHVAQIHHIQSHKFHLPPYRTDSLMAEKKMGEKWK